MHTRELHDDEYELEDEGRYTPDQDPVSAAVGSVGFVARHVIDECREEFPESLVSRFPETFDRFYWEPQRLLVDILEDGSPDQLAEEKDRKRVAFKTAWCEEHGWRYLALTATDAQDAQAVRELLHASGGSFKTGGVVPASPSTPVRRGTIVRPKANA